MFLYWVSSVRFWTRFALKGYFKSNKEKSKYYYQIQHIQISFGEKSHFNRAVFTFWTKFVHKRDFDPKHEK